MKHQRIFVWRKVIPHKNQKYTRIPWFLCGTSSRLCRRKAFLHTHGMERYMICKPRYIYQILHSSWPNKHHPTLSLQASVGLFIKSHVNVHTCSQTTPQIVIPFQRLLQFLLCTFEGSLWAASRCLWDQPHHRVSRLEEGDSSKRADTGDGRVTCLLADFWMRKNLT